MMPTQQPPDETMVKSVRDQQHTGNHADSIRDQVAGTRAGQENVEPADRKQPVEKVKAKTMG